MKQVKTAGSVVVVGLVIGTFVGCGGGGGGGSAAAPSTVSAESAAGFATAIADGIEGCTAVSAGAAPLYYVATTSSTVEQSAPLRTYSIDQTQYGNCGGSLHITGVHDSGTDTLRYTYDDFCMELAARDLSLDGASNVKNVGTPGTWGPIVSQHTISTVGSMTGAVVSGVAREVTKTFAASMTSYVFAYASGNENLPGSAGSPDSVTVSSVSLTDDQTGKTYRGSGLSAKVYESASGVNVVSASATVTDPDRGTYTVNASGVTIPLNAYGLPIGIDGTAEVTATDGTTGAVEFDNGMIRIYVDGAGGRSEAATVDCTELANDL